MNLQALDLDRTVTITDAQVRFYQEHGYLQIHNVLDAEEVEQVRADLAEVMAERKARAGTLERGNPFYRKVFVQQVNLWRDHAGIRRYTLSRRIGEIARRLAGVARMRLFHDHALIKMPEESLPSDWHQDWPYWPFRHVGALSCWMALDDVDLGNGCLQFVPGSYRWGIYPAIALGSGKKQLEQMLDEEHRAQFKPVTMPMQAGSCTFHDGLCYHYATPNSSGKPRRALASIYLPDGTCYRKKGHCVTDPLDLADGAKLEGEMLPLVAEGAPAETTTFHDASQMLAEAAKLNPLRQTRMREA